MVLTFKAPEGFDIDKPLERQYLLYCYARYKVQHNRHLIIACVGSPGSGKTYSMVSFANKCQYAINGKTFDVSKQLALTGVDFVNIVTNAEPGTVVIFDEIGAGMGLGFNSRGSMSQGNIALSSLFQTIRSRRLIILLTTPNFGFMDKSLRLLVDFYVTADKIDYKNEQNIVTFNQVQINKTTGLIYFHLPRISIWNKGTFLMKQIHFEKPPMEMIKTYEDMKFKYQENLNKLVAGNLKRMNDKAMGTDILNEEEKRMYEFHKQGKGKLEIYKLMGLNTCTGLRKYQKMCDKLGIPQNHGLKGVDPYESNRYIVTHKRATKDISE